MEDIKATLAQLGPEELAEIMKKLQPKTIIWPDLGPNKKPKQTIMNLKELLQFYNITVRYNEMTKDIDIDIPGFNFHSDIEANSKLAKLEDLSAQQELAMGPEKINNFVIITAGENSYHPVREWIDTHPWDGKDRLTKYYNTIETEEDNPLKEVFMRKWALSAVAALYGKNFSSEGVLTFQGKQGIGKTSWIESLIPDQFKNKWNKDSVIIDTKNKDTLIKALGYWIVEVGELDATFKRADIEALKGFITEKTDRIRAPYARKPDNFRRSTVFFATVNDQSFLQDSENRRFWVLGVKKFNYFEEDLGQFWAQVKHEYMNVKDKIHTAKAREENNEYGWFLSVEERNLLTPMQEQFKSLDPIQEILETFIVKVTKDNQSTYEYDAKWINTTLILEKCGYPVRAGDRKTLNTASKWLKTQGFKMDSKKRYLVQILTKEDIDTPIKIDPIKQVKLRKLSNDKGLY
jgi:putative DNA primase/helicase